MEVAFDWREETKEKYFAKAEKTVKAAGFDDLLKLDKGKFTVTKETIRVYFKSFPRKGNTKRWYEAKREIKGLEEQKAIKSSYGRKIKTVYLHAQMDLEREEKDK